MTRALAITGSYKGVTGHDHHTRSIARALHQRGVRIELHDLPIWSPAKLPESLQDPWFDEQRELVHAKVHLHFCMPHQVRRADGVRTVNYTMFEADRIPEVWARHSASHDLVVVPAESCRRAWAASGVPQEKVAVCPLGVDVTMFAPGVVPLSFDTASGATPMERRVRFLNVSDATDRKNLTGLLKAWLRATTKADDAALLLKAGFYTPGSQQRFDARVRELERAVGRTVEEAAPIFHVGGVFAPQAMPALYAAATHYISVSRGEGYDLPMVEAGASGLELIAPRHSAYLDYLTDRIAHLIPARRVQARLPDDPETEKFFRGAHWWEPEEDDACRIIREIIDGTAAPKESARTALSHLSWLATAERLEALLLT